MRLTKILILLLMLPMFSLVKAQDNNIKLNLVSLPLGIVMPQYERVLTPRFSLQLGLGLSPNKKIPKFTQNLIDDYVDNTSEGNASDNGMKTFFEELKYTTIILTPEARYFVSGKKGAPRGLYLGAFLRYTRHNGTSVYPEERDNGEIVDFDGTLTSNSFGGGVNLGIQWMIQDKISIDWNIIGLGINTTKMELLIESENMTPDDVESIKGTLTEEYGELEVEAGNDFVRGVYTGLLPILRFSLSIGYAF